MSIQSHCTTTQNHCEDWNKRLFAGNLRGDWWKLLILYTLTFGLMLFNTHGYYWDDWALIGNFNFDEMNMQFDQNSNYGMGILNGSLSLCNYMESHYLGFSHL